MLAIQNVLSLTGELQRNYIFKTVVEDYPTSLLANYPKAAPILEGFDCIAQNGIWPQRKNDNIVLEWGGENLNYTGVDKSTKNYEIVAIVDQECQVLDFFEACKDLTGNRNGNAFAPRTNSRLRLGCYLVSVDKETVVDYRQLTFVKVDDVNPEPLKKDGKELWKLKISGTWDFNNRDTSKRGQKI